MKPSTLLIAALVEVALLASAAALELYDHSANFLWIGATILFLSILSHIGDDESPALPAEGKAEPKCNCRPEPDKEARQHG